MIPSIFSAQFKYNSFEVEDIPHFNYPVEIDDRETQETILLAMVQENYQRIKTDVADLLRRY